MEMQGKKNDALKFDVAILKNTFMNRKKFISSVLPVIPALGLLGKQTSSPIEKPVVIPPYLKKGDLIGITCPSGFITPEELQPAVEQMNKWGYQIKIGRTAGLRDFTFAGSDDDRTADFQQMLNDKNIKAIMLGRGGYGAVRIIDKIDFSTFVKKTKWIIGFSDATVIHAHVLSNYGIASIHSKMCNSFPEDPQFAEQTQIDSIESIRKCLAGEKINYPVMVNVNNRQGKGEGILAGGNLSILENLAGTASDLNTEGKILFLEETGEYLYSIDRMLWNLKRSGKLKKLKGLIVGGFNNKADDPGEEFGKNIVDMVLEKVQDYSYPVCFNFPVGHQKENYALKCGVVHSLEVTAGKVSLTEKQVHS
jgi:muramoyltetrapeptide carboxypeptidase